MKEERMKILQMVDDGKISVEEAGKLLDGLKQNSEIYDECECSDFTDKMKDFCHNTEEFVKSVGCKIGEFAKDMEPRVRNVTKTVVEKTADIVEELGKALASCLNSLNNCDEKDKDCGCDCGCCETEHNHEHCEENREN